MNDKTNKHLPSRTMDEINRDMTWTEGIPMAPKVITSSGDIASAAILSTLSHERLRSKLPFLPARSEDDFVPRIERMTREGIVLGIFGAGGLAAYLGALPIENHRNAGPGSFGPDWCHGTIPGTDHARAYRQLYRELAPQLISLGCRIHSFAFYTSECEIVKAMALTGFGHIVMDAARPTAELLGELQTGSTDIEIGRASRQDATELSRLNTALVAHIAAAPVLMPTPRGMDAATWEEWLSEPERVALLAWKEGKVVGYIKAEEPQIDVSYAVHSKSTLAINGMYVESDSRCVGVGKLLLASLVREAAEVGKEIVSVDCETTNPEAYAFWSKWFEPVAYGLERRV